jgi:uncharacterized repeat protein (TIGR01451 family)
MNHPRIAKRLSASLIIGGLLMVSMPSLVSRATAADIPDNGTFATGGASGTFVKQTTGQSIAGTLTFEQSGANPAKFRIISLVTTGAASFGAFVVFNGGNSGRVFNFDPPILNTGVDFLAPAAGNQNATQLLVCGFPANASFTVTKHVTYPAGSVAEPTDPTTFAATISCVSGAGTGFNWASIKNANLVNNETTATISAPSGTFCTATDSSPLFNTTSAPSPLVLDADAATTESIVITNAKKPTTKTLTVSKVVAGAVAGDPPLFAFTVACTPAAPAPSPSSFSLANGATQQVIVPTGSSCTVTETSATNFSAVVTGDDADGIAIAMTSNKTITFTNTRQVGDLTITKVRNGGSASDVFSFAVDCGNNITRNGTITGSGPLTFTALPAGIPCTVSEAASPLYTTTPSLTQPITLAPGTANALTFTNIRKTGSLAISKIRNGGSPNDTFSFRYSCGGADAIVTLAGGETQTVLTGVETGTSCTVTEAANPLYLTDGGPTQTVAMTEGTKTVTFTNTRRTSGLTIVKVRNGGSANDAFTFTYDCGGTLTGTSTITGQGSVTPNVAIPVGTSCSVTEAADPLYATAGTGTETVVVGENGGIVTFTNTRRTGTLSMRKDRIGGSSVDQFAFHIVCGATTGDITITGSGTVTDTVGALPTGTSCTATETNDDRYTTTRDPAVGLAIVIAEGDNLVTFTNTRRTGSIIVTKQRFGGSNNDVFTFNIDCGAVPGGGRQITGSGSKTMAVDVPTGTTCLVSEVADSRYATTPSLTQQVTVVDNETNVTFTNTIITTDLGIDKTAPATVVAGSQLVYSMVVTNFSNATAVNPTVSDAIPTGTSFVSFSTISSVPEGIGWTCTTPAIGATSGSVSCTRASLGAGEVATFAMTVAVPSTTSSGTVVTNTAHTASSTPESLEDLHPNSDTVTTNVTTLASLSITKTPAAAYVAAGGTFDFTISVSNAGPSVATNVVVDDPVPAGLQPVAVVGSPCDAAGTHCTLGAVNVGETKTFVMRYLVLAGYTTPTTVTNTATVTSPTDPTPSSATASVPLAALTVDKAVASTPPPPIGGYKAGDQIAFDVTVYNTGAFALTGVKVEELVSGVTVTGCGTDSTLTPVVATGYAVAPGGQLRCRAFYTVTQPDVNLNTFTNSASGDSDQTSPSTATVTVNLPGNPSINVTKTVTSSGPYTVGSTMTFAVVVSNNGTVTLVGLTVVEQLDATLSACTPPASLNPGQSFSCTATHVVTQADLTSQSYTNEATASATPIRSETTITAKGTATVPTPSADLSIKKAFVGSIALGGNATFEVVVANNGPSPVSGVTVTDVPQFGMSVTSASGTGWTCTIANGGAVCTNAATVLVGATLPTLTVVGKITSLPSGTIQNRATVTSSLLDPNLSNNQATASDILPGVLDVTQLPRTGSHPITVVLFGALLMLVGVVMTVFARLSRAES